MFSLIAAFIIGLQHAFEIDHLATFSSFSNKNFKQALFDCLKWTSVHVGVVFLFALVLRVFNFSIPFEYFEYIVGVTLLAISLNMLRSVVKNTGFSKHSGKLGLLHGLSGTGALVVLSLVETSLLSLVSYSLLFGTGLLIGSLIICSAFCLPVVSSINFKQIRIAYSIFIALAGISLII